MQFHLLSGRRIVGITVLLLAGCASEANKPGVIPWRANQIRTIDRTAALAENEEAEKLAARHGLQFVNLTWEDTGRYKGSSVGPNISDMTIQVQRPAKTFFSRGEPLAMPVLRYPNFSDKTADLDPRNFTLLAGNERGQPLRRISLHDFLESPLQYLSKPDSWKAKKQSLLAPRDTRALVSAQACFLPVPSAGLAGFNPVLFNYQSKKGDPAVLTILATREGTSVTVIDNVRDAFDQGRAWGQRLFFNKGGQRASFTGMRLSDFSRGSTVPSQGESAGETGLNMVLLIQVPLKQRNPEPPPPLPSASSGGVFKEMCVVEEASDVEEAVIGHGKTLGPFVEIDNLEITRDERFPVRVTVQFYQATSNGIVSEADVSRLAGQIDRVYAKSDAVGSLVTEGKTGRVTEYAGLKRQPPGWWASFWKRHYANTGQTKTLARERLRRILGMSEPEHAEVSDLYLRDLLAD